MAKPRALVQEPNSRRRKTLLTALTRAGLAAREEGPFEAFEILFVGPGAKSAPALAKKARRAAPDLLVLAAVTGTKVPPWADAVVPLPISPADLAVRLPELRKRSPKAKAVRSSPVLDPLTGFYTFEHFKEVLFVEVKRARRYGLPLAMALVAFDPLGKTDPHLRAQLMGGLSLAIRRSIRDTDFPVQYTADRALVLMPHTELAGAVVVSRRICQRIAQSTLSQDSEVLRPTVSVGVASTVKGRELSFAELARHAQTSLDLAILKGGNRVEFFDPVGDVSMEEAS